MKLEHREKLQVHLAHYRQELEKEFEQVWSLIVATEAQQKKLLEWSGLNPLDYNSTLTPVLRLRRSLLRQRIEQLELELLRQFSA